MAARLEYKPAIDAARADIRVSKANQRQLNKFYGSYRGAVNTSAEKSNANTQRLYQQSRDTARDLGDRYDNKINQLAAEDARSAELRGAQSDSSNQQRSLAGESQRQNLMNADSKLLSQLGASSSAYLRNVALASRQGQRLDNRRERNRQQDARNKIRDAKKERNQKINVLRAEQRQAERDWRIQKAAFSPKGYNAAMRDQSRKSLQAAKINERTVRYQSDKGVQQSRINSRNNRGGGGGSGYSRAEATSMIRATLSKNGLTWRDAAREPRVVVDGLVNRGVSRPVARRAVSRFIKRKRKRANRKPKNIGDVKGGSHN